MRFSYILAILFLTIGSLFLNETKAQSVSLFEKGEVLFANSELKKGFIWLSRSANGTKSLYFKTVERSISQKFTPNDIISFTISKGHKKYVSERIVLNDSVQIAFTQVHFIGEYSLLSYIDAKIKIFYLKDTFGNFIELRNTFTLPNRENNYQIEYYREYLDELRSFFSSYPELNKYIEQTEFSAKSLSELLVRFHKGNNFTYIQYPPTEINCFFVGAGSSYSSLKHISLINSSFISQSPFVGISLFGGMRIFKGLIKISFESSFNYGIIFHDDYINEAGNITTYYEDITKTTILSNSINISIKPVEFGKISPFIAVGANYNTYLNYSRELIEEQLFNDYNLVIRNYTDDFQKPNGFPGIILKSGFNIEITETDMVMLNYQFSQFIGVESGPHSIQSVAVSYVKNIF